MSMRQLHDNDPMRIQVTDKNGERHGLVLEKHDQWCWVAWHDSSAPTTEHQDDLWILDQGSLSLKDLQDFVRAWAPKGQGELAFS